MIAQLKGIIRSKKSHSIVLEVNDIGFDLVVPNTSLFSIGTVTTLATVFYWNQETGPQLFGFSQESEKALFNLVISCSGCGPKLGLAVVAHIGLAEFIAAVESANIAALSAINGIGKKKAEQLILSLKDKVASLEEYATLSSTIPLLGHIKKMDDVLTSLGYTRQEIMAATEIIRKQDVTEFENFDLLLRKTLSFLAKKQI